MYRQCLSLPLVDSIYTTIYDSIRGSLLASLAVRATLVSLCLLPPTILMGATLPLFYPSICPSSKRCFEFGKLALRSKYTRRYHWRSDLSDSCYYPRLALTHPSFCRQHQSPYRSHGTVPTTTIADYSRRRRSTGCE